jgi:ATP-binding cassette subfamily F protein uup
VTLYDLIPRDEQFGNDVLLGRFLEYAEARRLQLYPAQEAALSRDAATKPAKPRKMSFKETRELEGMEAQIHAVEAEVARIEGLFANPDFFQKHATQVNQLTAELDAAKEKVTQLYSRWEELEAVRVASVPPPANGAAGTDIV